MSDSPIRPGHRRAGRRVSWLAASVLLGGITLGGEVPRAALGRGEPAERPEASVGSSGFRRLENRTAFEPFTRERLMPRVSGQLEVLSALSRAEPHRDLADQTFFDDLARSVQRGAKRATRGALEDYLRETTDIEARLDRLWHRRHRAQAQAEPGAEQADGGERKNLSFNLGVHHLVPGVKVRYSLPNGALKLRVEADGSVGLSYSDHRSRRARLHAGFDGDDRYALGLAIGF